MANTSSNAPKKDGTRKKVWPPSDASVEIQRQIKHKSSPLEIIIQRLLYTTTVT